ncbi:hypothetical protein J2I47_21865 [Fibrella sp. HMF5335]|uniref:Uncharacterized protein n=2 Tax=Cytophagales TaxID=768507 RepID=A0A4Q2UC37_9BACT|nr:MULTISPECIES: hypothetical protein [Cytophagales]MBO0939217.1 hypothetical protein [Fibrella rubiginis]RYC66663.1 hypothetical protein EQG79_27875 [Spirosoma sordidisoli]
MAKTMNPYLQTLYDQIGRMAFFMMGAKNITFDNASNVLQWRIANSKFNSVQVRYDIGEDLYQLTFSTETKQTITEVVMEQVEASDLHATIERMTGLRLSLARVYA